MDIRCQYCGTPVPIDAAKCPTCGAPDPVSQATKDAVRNQAVGDVLRNVGLEAQTGQVLGEAMAGLCPRCRVAYSWTIPGWALVLGILGTVGTCFAGIPFFFVRRQVCPQCGAQGTQHRLGGLWIGLALFAFLCCGGFTWSFLMVGRAQQTFNEAHAAYQAGNLDQARNLYHAYIDAPGSTNDQDARAYVVLGVIAFRQGDEAAARDCFEHAVRLDRDVDFEEGPEGARALFEEVRPADASKIEPVGPRRRP